MNRSVCIVGFETRIGLTVLAALLVASCSGTDSDHTRSSQLSQLSEWELIEELRLGSVDDPNFGFSQIRGVQGQADGSVLVGEGLLREVREYSPSGELVGRVGGRGQGPGEFESLSAFGFSNETIWVQDTRNLRVTLFSRDGELQATIPGNRFSHVDGESVVLIAPRHPRGDGTFLGAPVQWVFDDSIRIPVVTFTPAGEVADTLRWDILRDPQVDDGLGGRTAVQVGGATLYLRDRLLPSKVVRFRSTHSTVAVELEGPSESGPTSEVRLWVIQPDGDTLLETRFSYEPVPVAESVITSRLEDLLSFAEQVGAERAAAESTMRRHLDIPSHFFPISGAAVGEDGGVWLRREDVGEGSSVRWSALDVSGHPVGEIQLPANAQIEWATADQVWVSVRDELDVPFLIRYRVRRP